MRCNGYSGVLQVGACGGQLDSDNSSSKVVWVWFCCVVLLCLLPLGYRTRTNPGDPMTAHMICCVLLCTDLVFTAVLHNVPTAVLVVLYSTGQRVTLRVWSQFGALGGSDFMKYVWGCSATMKNS